MAQDIAIELTGTKLDRAFGPAIFGELSRSAAGGADDEFIPGSYVKVRGAWAYSLRRLIRTLLRSRRL
jgi:hypothetical protein